MGLIVLPLFYKDSFGIKSPAKIYMLLNEETKTKQTKPNQTKPYKPLPGVMGTV